MSTDARVLRADDPERSRLEREGWTIVARSWAAALDAASCETSVLRELATRAARVGFVRVLTSDDAAAVLALDAATLRDYPGAEATAHEPLTAVTAAVSGTRRGHGVFGADSALVAMTFVDLDIEAHSAEVDFTVVAPQYRGRGLAIAVKAASVLDLLDAGVRGVRTGGAMENRAILAANLALGFVVDEEWVTLKR